ncbi:carboxylesterase/lipase family protein [Bradyrhizobium sp. DASA03007]|uniref:carboxylesterase/lipase family protein n=1 Tax=unclassified Bradyrhizobium TaxID=2631580 RepID=UPI003F6F9744
MAFDAANGPVVAIDSGNVRGISQEGAEVFRGIPYAAPPLGPLRWRPPQAAISWPGIRAADEFGPACSQSDVPFTPPVNGTSEDCLTINVWRPLGSNRTKRPVMVLIPGGGFFNGGSGTLLYDGAPFANAGILFVSFNYRLGRFGFFAHPSLTQAHANEPLGNYGFMDQIAALRWVKRNIAAFGGDPENVTICGESAGARSVAAMLIAPQARGLFRKAILQSSTHGMHREPPLHRQAGVTRTGESLGEAFLETLRLGRLDAAGLRALPAETIVSGLGQTSPQRTTFAGPMIDGKIMTDSFGRAFETGGFTPVPIIIGTTDYEARVFLGGIDLDGLLSGLGDNREPLLQAFTSLYPEPEQAARLLTEALYYEPARAIARSFAKLRQPVYSYRFSYRPHALRAKIAGALHASELPFMLDNLSQTPATSMGPDWTSTLFNEPLTFTEDDRKMAKAMNAYWINFVKTGNPNGHGLPRWTASSTEPDAIMNFRESGAITESDPTTARLDMFELVNRALRS